jgi:glycosyltransferase involved in cell wall biosynthesis
MRIGIVARCDDTGLGNQTRELVNMLQPDKILLINSRFFNQNKQHTEWYDGYNYKTTVKGFPTSSEIADFVKGVDVVISCETFYNPKFIDIARKYGVKTILQYNYEFFGNLTNPDWSLPDILIAPSLWNMDKIVQLYGDRCKVVYLPPPTNHEKFKNAKENNISKTHNRILHIGGKAAVKDRNGTNTVIDMLRYSKGDYEVVIKTQSELNISYKNDRLTIETNTTKDPQDLYSGYDAMVLPRRYAGLCLPMNEALLSGLPVFMPRISPNNVILPDEWTVEASKIDEFKAKAIIDVYDVDPKTLASRLDYYMKNKNNTIKQKAFDLGFINFSTESLKDKYINLINS